MQTLGLRVLDSKTPVMTWDETHRSRSLNNSLSTLIAFALIERSEAGAVSRSSSQNESRESGGSQNSSKHNEGRPAELVDLLLIHTVVQRFFVDVLNDIKQSGFWLERSASVFCHAFDEAAKLNGKNLGLLDDYRCFKTHGQMVLEHLSQIQQQKKTALSPGIFEAKANVERRLDACSKAIMDLSEATQVFLVNDMDFSSTGSSHENLFSVPSVFERANTFSDMSSSNSTSQSSHNSADNSAISTRTGTGLDDERAGVHIISTDTTMNVDMDEHIALEGEMQPDNVVGLPPRAGKGKEPMRQMWANTQMLDISGDGTVSQSPDLVNSFAASLGDNPYSWHVPYPPTRDTIPAPPSPDNERDSDGAMTEVPTPQPNTATSPVDAELEQADHIRAFGLRYPRSSMSHHRVIQRNNERRYHDRGGAWRGRFANDPRREILGSLSYEPARGSVIMPRTSVVSSGHAGTASATTESAAKLYLSSLHTQSSRALPPPSKMRLATNEAGGQLHQIKGRAQSTGAIDARSLLDVQQSSRAQEVPTGHDADPPSSPSYGHVSGTSPSLNSALQWVAKYFPSRSASPRSKDQDRAEEAESRNGDNRIETPPRPDTENSLVDSIENLSSSWAQSGPTGVYYRGSRTARSTPIHSHGPFQPPVQYSSSQHNYNYSYNYQTQPASFLQAAENTASAYGSAEYDLPSTIPRWENDVYHPGQDRLNSDDLSFDMSSQSHMMLSYGAMDETDRPGPSTGPSTLLPQQGLGVPLPAQYLQQHLFEPRNVDGYSSQPMSRNTSNRSQSDNHAHGYPVHAVPSDFVFPAGQTQMRMQMQAGGHEMERNLQSRSSPQSFDGREFDGQPLPVRAQQIPILRRNSRSSLVQTEPSPELENPLADVNTSYRQWERHVHLGQPDHSGRFVSYETKRPTPETASLLRAGRAMASSSGGSSHRSGSGSGSGSRSGGRNNVSAGHGRPGSSAMSRSQSDQGPRTIPEIDAWVPAGPYFPPWSPPGAIGAMRGAPYPAHLASIGGQDGHLAQRMSRNPSDASPRSARARRAADTRQ